MDQWINSGSVDPQNGRISLIRQGMTEYPKMQNAFLYKKKVWRNGIAMEIIKLFKSNSGIQRGIGDLVERGLRNHRALELALLS